MVLKRVFWRCLYLRSLLLWTSLFLSAFLLFYYYGFGSSVPNEFLQRISSEADDSQSDSRTHDYPIRQSSTNRSANSNSNFGAKFIRVKTTSGYRNDKIEILEDNEIDRITGVMIDEDSPTYSCQAPVVDPFDPSIAEWIEHPRRVECQRVQADLAYLDGDGILRVNRTEMKRESKSGTISCYYRYFDFVKNDRDYQFEEKRPFAKDFKLKKPFVKVVCEKEPNSTRIYVNYFVHPILPKSPDAHNSSTTIPFPQSLTHDGSDFNVFIFAIDSMARSMAYRHLPKTIQYLNDTGTIMFENFHKVGENTKPNLAAILTGMRLRREQEDMKAEMPVDEQYYHDHWPFVWKEFKERRGYESVYLEESPELGTFHYGTNGFRKKPSDHYYYSYWLAQARQKDLMSRSSDYCIGNRPQHQVYLDILRRNLNQSATFNRRQFVFSIHSELSHDSSSDLERADDDFERFFKDLDARGQLNRTILIFMGDHGPRFTKPRRTVVGFVEERSPFLGIRLPPGLNSKFPRLREGMNLNARHRLCSMFDLHETLLDILNQTYDGPMIEDRSIRGRSLFRPIPEDRRCFQAGVPDRYCLCEGFEIKPIDHKSAIPAGEAVLDELNTMMRKFYKDKCVEWKLKEILYFVQIRWPGEKTGKTKSYFVALRTKQVRAIFEGVVVRNLEDETVRARDGTLERINKQEGYGSCLEDIGMWKFCACKSYVGE